MLTDLLTLGSSSSCLNAMSRSSEQLYPQPGLLAQRQQHSSVSSPNSANTPITTSGSKPSSTSLPAKQDRNPIAEQYGWFTVRPFVLGGIAACWGQTCVQPIDLIKTRVQLAGEGQKIKVSPIQIARDIIKQDGFFSMYRGLSAGYLRQWTYGCGRLGMFRTLADAAQSYQDKKLGHHQAMPFYVKMGCGLAAGAFGAALGTPADAALVRMQADSMLPLDQRRNYRNGVHAMYHSFKTDGLSGMFSGTTPSVVRAMAQNAMMLGCYEQAKEFFHAEFGKSQASNFAASFTAGMAACTASLPFDFMKTRIQKQRRRPDGTMPYKNMFDVARQTIQKEGVLVSVLLLLASDCCCMQCVTPC